MMQDRCMYKDILIIVSFISLVLPAFGTLLSPYYIAHHDINFHLEFMEFSSTVSLIAK